MQENPDNQTALFVRDERTGRHVFNAQALRAFRHRSGRSSRSRIPDQKPRRVSLKPGRLKAGISSSPFKTSPRAGIGTIGGKRGDLVTVTLSDGRKTTADIRESMLRPETLARMLLLQKHRAKRSSSTSEDLLED